MQLDPELQDLERKLRSLKPKRVAVSMPMAVHKYYGIRWAAAILTLAGSVLAVVCLVVVPKEDVPNTTMSEGLCLRLGVEYALTPRQQLRQMIDEMELQPKPLPMPDYPVVEIVVTNRPYQPSLPSVLPMRKLPIFD